MSIPIITNKPLIAKELKEVVDKLDIVSSLMLMGILLDHALKLCGLHKQEKK